MRAAIALLLALALTACQTVKPADPALPAAPIDARIAAVSAELAGYCSTARALLPIVGAFATKPTAIKAVASARVGVARFCEAPPENVNEAIATLAQIAGDLVAVWRAGP